MECRAQTWLQTLSAAKAEMQPDEARKVDHVGLFSSAGFDSRAGSLNHKGQRIFCWERSQHSREQLVGYQWRRHAQEDNAYAHEHHDRLHIPAISCPLLLSLMDRILGVPELNREMPVGLSQWYFSHSKHCVWSRIKPNTAGYWEVMDM